MSTYHLNYALGFLRLVAMITLILPVLTLAQIGVTEFPKISFVDPYWMHNTTDPEYYYDDIQTLGINLVVTDGRVANVDTMQNHHLQIWNADLGGAGHYVSGMVNEYPISGGFFSDPDPSNGQAGPEEQFFHSSTSQHVAGPLIQETQLNTFSRNRTFYYFLRCKIELPLQLPPDTPVAQVHVWEVVPENREISPPDEDEDQNGDLLKPENINPPPHLLPTDVTWTITIADLLALGDTGEIVTWKSPGVTLGSAYDNYFELNWSGLVNFWIYRVEVKDPYNWRLTTHPSASTYAADVENDLIPVFNRNPEIHFQWYKDEPKLDTYQSYHLVDSISANFAAVNYLRLNGATGGVSAGRVQQFIATIHPPQLLYDYYPLLDLVSLYTDAFPEHNATQDLQWGLRYRFIDRIKPVISQTQAEGIPFWMTIQVQHEKYLRGSCDTLVFRLRDPTPAEISVQAYLSLAYGAKGIMYFLLPTGRNGDSHYVYRGLLDVVDGTGNIRYATNMVTSEGQECDSVEISAFYDEAGEYTPNEKWWAVQELNWQLDHLADVVLPLTFQWQNGFTLTTVGQSATEPGVVEELVDATFDNAYIEVSNFVNTTTNENYFWLVNRRCLETETQKVTIRLNDSQIPRLIEDVLASRQVWNGDSDRVAYRYLGSGEDEITVKLKPGEGKLFRITDGLTGLQHVETYWSGQVVCKNTTVVPSDGILTIYPGTEVHVQPNTRLVVNGSLHIQGTPDSPVTFTTDAGATWTGISVSGGVTEVDYCEIQSAAGSAIGVSSQTTGWIRNSNLHDNNQGLSITNVDDDFEVRDNAIHHNQTGIFTRTSQADMIGNHVYENSQTGVLLTAGTNGFIANNEIDHNGNGVDFNSAGMYLVSSSPVMSKTLLRGTLPQENNLIHDNNGYGIYSSFTGLPNLGTLQESALKISGGFNHFYNNSNTALYRNDNASTHPGDPMEIPADYPSLMAEVNYWFPSLTDESAPGAAEYHGAVEWYPVAATFNNGGTSDDYEHVALLGDGLIAEQDAEYEVAIDFYQQFLASDPPNKDQMIAAMSGMDRCYGHLKAVDQWQEQLEAIAANFDKEEQQKLAQNYLIWVYKKLGLDAEAIAQAQALIEDCSDPEYIDYYTLEIALLLDETDGGVLAKASPEQRQISDQIKQAQQHLLAMDAHTEAANVYKLIKGIPVSPENALSVPKTYALAPAYPNPFNPVTSIRYDLPEASRVRVTVYDIRGRLVTTLTNEDKLPGSYHLQWQGKDASGRMVGSGLYFYTLEAVASETNQTFHASRKMLLMK